MIQVTDVVTGLDKDVVSRLNARISTMGDTAQERILIDKSLIGRKEVEKFLNSLLVSIWEKGDWKASAPVLTTDTKNLIALELSPKLLDIELDPKLESDEREQKIVEA